MEKPGTKFQIPTGTMSGGDLLRIEQDILFHFGARASDEARKLALEIRRLWAERDDLLRAAEDLLADAAFPGAPTVQIHGSLISELRAAVLKARGSAGG